MYGVFLLMLSKQRSKCYYDGSMTERYNGKAPFTRRTHGSERRGVFPVPNLNAAYQLEQSQRDTKRRLERIRERLEARVLEREPQKSDLGNKDLPAYAHKLELVDAIEEYKAVIVGGATGSGKSTQLPQYLYEAGYDMTIALVPRRVIADGLGERIREEMASQIEDFNPEESIGIVHGERSESHENNKIMVMTPNTFIKMEAELRERFGDKKLAIIADEIHEANLFTEIATGVAAMSVQDNEHWRLIAASATHNAETLTGPFGKINGGEVPTIEIEGRPFNVDLVEMPEVNSMQAYAQIGDQHEKTMIFTSGKREIDHIIKETTRELVKSGDGTHPKVVFRKLHGDLTEVELAHIDDPIPEGYRLVVVASPAGMSGITIPGVTLVITDGTINRSELDEDGAAGLKRFDLSKAGITQQIGRAGRDVPGGIGVLTKPTTIIDDAIRSRGGHIEVSQMEYLSFDQRKEHEPPEIYNSNLSRVVLSVAALNQRFSGINKYIPHPVEPSEIVKAEESLARLGALDDEDKVTITGISMDTFPVIPELARGLHEASRPGRGLQHMARAAFIAASIDVGGLQDFSDKSKSEWKNVVRSTTTDDFIAQLDIMTQLEHTVRNEERTLYDFVDTYTLHPKRVERARKAARKILHAMSVNIDNIIVTPPLPNEETQLRRDFTAGMIDLVYEEVGIEPRSKKVQYRNIHGNSDSGVRTISDRSASTLKRGQFVAGIPRWYETQIRNSKEFIRHDIIDHVLAVKPEDVGEYAKQNNLLQGSLSHSRIEGDRVVEYEQMKFGSIEVGKPAKSVWRDQIPESSRKVLVRQSLERPGEVQSALRDVADELEWYRKRIPAADIATYRQKGAPDDITKTSIRDLIERFAKTTRSLHEIDQQLGQYLYSTNLSINKYFDDETRAWFQERSPDSVVIGGEITTVHYDAGQPYVTHLTRQQKKALDGPVHLKDGREVLLQVTRANSEKVRVSLA